MNSINIVRKVLAEGAAKSVTIGNKAYILPFRQNGNWVEDSRGNNVAECYSRDVAKGLAKILNESIPS